VGPALRESDLIRPLATFSTQEGVEKGLDLDLPPFSKNWWRSICSPFSSPLAGEGARRADEVPYFRLSTINRAVAFNISALSP
jgi:hypothetical protein